MIFWSSRKKQEKKRKEEGSKKQKRSKVWIPTPRYSAQDNGINSNESVRRNGPY